jgi:tripartite-type tricarboxylate transporter receptor subunit TctC
MAQAVFTRRIAGTIAACLFAIFTAPAFAQPYPSKPVKLVVPIAPSGSTDRLARAIASAISEVWRNPVIVDNKPGASGMIAAEFVARSPADGYTALVAQVSLVQVPNLIDKVSYDVDRDFAGVSLIGTVPVVLVVRSDSPYRTLQEYLQGARTRSTPVSFGSFGLGSSFHIYGETLAKDAKVSLLHIPYKGEGPALTDLLGGQLDSTFSSVSSAKPLISAGRVRALAVVGRATSAMPDVPSLVDLGFPRLDVRGWFGIVLPAGTPPEIVQKFYEGVAAAIKRREVSAIFAETGGEIVGSTPAQTDAFLRQERAKWKDLIESTGVKQTMR